MKALICSDICSINNFKLFKNCLKQYRKLKCINNCRSFLWAHCRKPHRHAPSPGTGFSYVVGPINLLLQRNSECIKWCASGCLREFLIWFQRKLFPHSSHACTFPWMYRVYPPKVYEVCISTCYFCFTKCKVQRVLKLVSQGKWEMIIERKEKQAIHMSFWEIIM